MFPNIEAERVGADGAALNLAGKLRVSYSTFKNWMRGETDIPCSKVIEMSELFSCSTDYLLGMDSLPKGGEQHG